MLRSLKNGKFEETETESERGETPLDKVVKGRSSSGPAGKRNRSTSLHRAPRKLQTNGGHGNGKTAENAARSDRQKNKKPIPTVSGWPYRIFSGNPLNSFYILCDAKEEGNRNFLINEFKSWHIDFF